MMTSLLLAGKEGGGAEEAAQGQVQGKLTGPHDYNVHVLTCTLWQDEKDKIIEAIILDQVEFKGSHAAVDWKDMLVVQIVIL